VAISTTKQLSATTEMNALTEAVGKTKSEHVTNQDIRQQCGTQPIGEWVLKLREEFDNHISRMREDRIVRAERDIIPKGRRPKTQEALDRLLFFKKNAISLTKTKKERRKHVII
jgi:hypothetical protein